MGIIREPLDVDFVVEPITEEDSRALALAIAESKRLLKIKNEQLLKSVKIKPYARRMAKVLAT